MAHYTRTQRKRAEGAKECENKPSMPHDDDLPHIKLIPTQKMWKTGWKNAKKCDYFLDLTQPIFSIPTILVGRKSTFS